MKEFTVKSNGKSYKVKAKDAQHAAALVKMLCRDKKYSFETIDEKGSKGSVSVEAASETEARQKAEKDLAREVAMFGKKMRLGKLYNVWDSVKDEAASREVLQQLLDDETAAIGAYDIAIKNEDGKLDEKAIEVLRAIRDDELRHRENLNAIMSGNVTEKNLEDSVHDFERKDFNDVRVVERSGQVSIGWASLGAVSIAEAESFMRDLQKAINYAKTQR